MAMRNNKIYVIGHKNPDTDSICSAIAYAYLKNQSGSGEYVASRAGQINEETQFVLNYFNADIPEYVNDIRTRVKDIEIRETEGVRREISLRKAWTLMKELNVVTLPVTRNGRLEGVITTEDIAEAYMNVGDSSMLSLAHTEFTNIVETLEGEMVCGNIDEYYTKGKVLVAAANTDIMKQHIEEGDLIITGDRYEAQKCAIESGAGCLIICLGTKIHEEIIELAGEKNCSIISTPFDTFTVARLITQSMPISYFMCRDNVVAFRTDAFTDDIRSTMAKLRHRDFPIQDKKGKYIGMISRRNLLNADKKKVILVDHNERSQAVDGLSDAEILEVVDHHRIGALETMSPVYFRNQPVGCTATIIYQLFAEAKVDIPEKIAGLLCSAILSDTLMFRSPTCTEIDKIVAKELAAKAGIIIEDYARAMFRAGSNLKKKSPEEIFYQDFKRFVIGEYTIGVGQISSLDADELSDIKDKLVNYLSKAYSEHGVQIIYFMLTNIDKESTEVIFVGDGGEELLIEAFGKETGDNSMILPGVVSRKKQFIPPLIDSVTNG